MKTSKGVANLSNINQVSCNYCRARKTCLISTFREDEYSDLSNLIHHEKPMLKGERLFFQGDPFNSLYLIRSGCFKSCIVDESGEKQVTGFHLSTDILGIDGVDSGKHMREVEALETSSVCSLPFDCFKEVSIRGNEELYRRLVCAVSCMMYRESHLMMVLGKMKAEQRLVSFLLDVSKRMADRGESALEFRLSMARYDIANYLGLAVETVSRLFKRLEEHQLIIANRHRVRIVDMDGLHLLMSGGDNNHPASKEMLYQAVS